MKACLRFAPMIGARPGELAEQETLSLAEHLATCEACQARLADEEALSGMLPEALMAEANQRDFSTFADGVMARVQPRRGVLPQAIEWVRRHRAAAFVSAFAPAAVAVALVLYLTAGSGSDQHATFEVSSERGGAMVLETSDGPVVLIGSDDSQI
jgi:anti-sigma factor RsiW